MNNGPLPHPEGTKHYKKVDTKEQLPAYPGIGTIREVTNENAVYVYISDSVKWQAVALSSEPRSRVKINRRKEAILAQQAKEKQK